MNAGGLLPAPIEGNISRHSKPH